MKQKLASLFRRFARYIFGLPDDMDFWRKESAGDSMKTARRLMGLVRKDIPHDFRTFLDRESRVKVNSVKEAMAWLSTCQYVTDKKQFGRRDYWQHPCDFENSKKGDCEDHALWVWRKMMELGRKVEFVLGACFVDEKHRFGPHAWVHIRHERNLFVWETTRKDERAILPLKVAKPFYAPMWSIDSEFKELWYDGTNIHFYDLRPPLGFAEKPFKRKYSKEE